MSAEVRIVGQGLAGSLLGWAFERAGIAFEITDLEKPKAASQIAAGIINPITGQRLVKSWRIDELLPIAVETYRDLESALGQRFLFPYRLRRLFANEREKQIAAEKWARGEFAPFGASLEEHGIWISPAYRVDTAALVTALKGRWQKDGHWHSPENASCVKDFGLTIRCLGAAELSAPFFAFAGLSAAKGELIDVETDPLDPDVIVNQKQWLLPLTGTRARVGATFVPGDISSAPTEASKAALAESAGHLLGEKKYRVVAHLAGTRVVTVDKHPVIGRHPEKPSMGILNGLGSKGALLAPWLAQGWVEHLRAEQPFDPSVDIARFWRRSSRENPTDPN